MFDSVDSRDIERICSMKEKECNRDGMAIQIAVKRLIKRPERKKCLLVISDGKPNNGDYRGKIAVKDIQETVRNAKKHNVEIIPVAIGSDKEEIEMIYGKFIDITDLNRMPKQLLKFLKRRIFR